MSARTELVAKLRTLNNTASECRAQGRNPRDMPITLAFAIDLTTMVLALAVEVEERASGE